MRLLCLAFCLMGSLLLTSCGGESGTSGYTDDSARVGDDTTADNATDATAAEQMPDCALGGKELEDNRYWSKDNDVMLAIVADSTTFDTTYGDSHRVLEVYNATSCERLQREVLPVNESPDFPYYIGEINYNNDSELVGIRGANVVYIYDIANRNLLPQLQPAYLTERLVDDAQSGQILRLEVWEDYLVGYAQDKGTFAFNIMDKSAPKAVMPFAEFKMDSEEYHSLFLFPSESGMVQPSIPQYDMAADEFSINPLLAEPQDLNTNIPKAAKNNRYLVLRKNNSEEAVLLDMQQARLVDLPTDVKVRKTQDILQWARENG